MTLDYGNFGIFPIMGNAGFISLTEVSRHCNCGSNNSNDDRHNHSSSSACGWDDDDDDGPHGAHDGGERS